VARKYLTPIDLTGLELQNAKIQNLATDPSAYGKGHVYFNTTHNELRVYDGTNWQPVGGAIAYGNTASRPAAGNAGNAYADTQTQTLYIDNGTSWVQIGVNPGDLSTAISNAALTSTDQLSEGTTNLYYTDSRARGAVSASSSQGLSYDSGTGVFSVDYTSLESNLVTDGFAKTSDIPTAQSITNEIAGDLVTGSTYLTTGTDAGNTYVDLNLSTLETQLTTDGYAKTSDIPSLSNYIQTGDDASLTSLTLTHNGSSGENLKIGDDSWLGDVNLSNTFNVKGVEDGTQGFISFGNNGTLISPPAKNNYVGFNGSDLQVGSANHIILLPTSGYAYLGTPLMDGSNRIAKLSDISGNYISSVDSNIFNVSSGTLQLNSVVSFNDGELHLKKTEYWYGGDVSGTQEGVIEAHSDGTFRVSAISNNLVLESNNGLLSLAGDSGVESLSNFQTSSGANITSGNNLYVKNGIYAGGTDTSTDGYLYIQDASGNNLVGLSGTAGAGLIEAHGQLNLYASYSDGGTHYLNFNYDPDKNLFINASQNHLVLNADSSQYFLGSVSDDNRIVSRAASETLTNKTLTTAALGSALDAGSYKIENLSNPTAGTDAANKQYVDAVAQGINIHTSADVATAGSDLGATFAAGTTDADGGTGIGATLTASSNGAIVIDGYTSLVVGSRVLVKDQTDLTQNGVYVVTTLGDAGTPWVLTRAEDYNNSIKDQVIAGDFVFISFGNSLANTAWVQINEGTGTDHSIKLGTDELYFTQFAGAGTYTANSGVKLDGNTFQLDLATNGGLTVNGGNHASIKLRTDSGLSTTTDGLAVNAGTGISVSGSTVAIDSTVVQKYAALVGDGTNTSFTVTHNLGTRDVVVSVYDAATYEEVMTDVTRTSTSAISVGFAVAPSANAYRVVVHA